MTMTFRLAGLVLAVILGVGTGPVRASEATGLPRDHRWPGVDSPVEAMIPPERLSEIMDAGQVQIVDIRNPDAKSALFSYAAGHVPGAVNVPFGQWRTVWSDPEVLPTDADLTALVRSAGLVPKRPVVIVHSAAAKANFGSAAWTYWVLKSAGFRRIAILDGGIRAWTAAGLPLSREAVAIRPSRATVRLDPTWLATHRDVTAVLDGSSDAQLLDARPLKAMRGLDPLEGSARLGSDELVRGADGAAGDMMPIFERIKMAAGVDWQTRPVIAYCNNGTLAAIDWFMASEVAGIPQVKVYGHSLSARQKAGLTGRRMQQALGRSLAPLLDVD